MAGRKGKYHEWLTEEGLLKIEGWARDGLIEDQVAANMGISRSSLAEWKNRFPEILDALKRGKEVVDRQVENALFKRAIGYSYEEVEQWIEEVGGVKKKRMKKITRQALPDVTAQIFWLKNRKPKEWRDRVEQHVEHSGEIQFIDDIGGVGDDG